MKKILLIAAVTLAAFFTHGQSTNQPPLPPTTTTNLPAPILSGPVTNLFNFLATGSNWIAVGYGIVSSDGEKYGGGIALAYKVTEFFLPVVRMDYYDNEIWLPSGSLQLQLPITISGKVRVTPFLFGGIATPLNSEDRAGEIVGIFGIGAAVGISKHLSVIADVEAWTGFEAEQIRFGLAYKF